MVTPSLTGIGHCDFRESDRPLQLLDNRKLGERGVILMFGGLGLCKIDQLEPYLESSTERHGKRPKVVTESFV
jgi:hypothetical protein